MVNIKSHGNDTVKDTLSAISSQDMSTTQFKQGGANMKPIIIENDDQSMDKYERLENAIADQTLTQSQINDGSYQDNKSLLRSNQNQQLDNESHFL